MGKRILLFFTDSYPYGSFEPYIESEVSFLSSKFDKILVFPINTNIPLDRKIPNNFRIVDIHKMIKGNFWLFFNKTFLILEILFVEIFSYKNRKLLKLKNRIGIIKRIKTIYNGILYSRAIVRFLNEENLLNNYEIVGYSYWFYHWSFINSLLKKQGIITNSISRAHSYDLYDSINYNFFSTFKIKYLDKVFPVSKHGEKYLKNYHPKYTSKISSNYLGTIDYGTNPFIESDKFKIASCSAVRDIKRLHLIIEFLEKVKCEVEWVHFGDGPLFNEIKTLALRLPSNIKYTFMGKVSNEVVLDYYIKNQINLFINVSEKEGLPISLMEAISFGIPVLGTDIFGVPEIVNDNTGILLPVNFDVQKVADIISKFPTSTLNTFEFRKKVKNYWLDQFEKKMNFELFYSYL